MEVLTGDLTVMSTVVCSDETKVGGLVSLLVDGMVSMRVDY